MRNVKLVLGYEGTRFHGFQVQAGTKDRTVQGVLEERLLQVTGEHTKLVAAGRTDAGVHAIGQVVSFRTASKMPTRAWAPALNAGLPPDVCVVEAADVPYDFHARYWARRKTYRYLIQNGRVPAVLWRNFAHFVPTPLDEGRMAAAAGAFVGEHDFASLQASGSAVRSTLREIFRLDVVSRPLDGGDLIHLGQTDDTGRGVSSGVSEGAEGRTDRDGLGRLVAITVTADGFLYNMVRIMAGLLVEVGQGKREPEEMTAILEARDRRRAGVTAPAHGLCLVRVEYPDYELSDKIVGRDVSVRSSSN